MFKIDKSVFKFFLLVQLSITFSLGASYKSNAAERELICSENLSRINCDLRSAEPFNVEKVLVKTGDKEIKGASYTKLSDLKKPTILTFMLDLNVKQDPVLFSRQKKLISTIVNSNLQNVNFEVVGFSNANIVVAPAGTAPATISLALKGLLQNGKTTELLKSAFQFIDQAKGREDVRKVLVILSDGVSDEKAYTPQEISSKFSSNNYTVYSVIPSHTKSDLQAAQTLQRFSDENHGKLFPNADDRDTEAASLIVGASVSNGGIISFDKTGQEFTISVNTSSSTAEVFHYKSVSDKNIIDGSTDLAGATNPSPSEKKSAFDEFKQPLIDWYNLNDTNKFISYGAGLLALIVLFVLISRLRLPRNRRTTMPALETVSVSDNNFIRPILAWFEILDGNNSQETINSQSTTIGRQKDNDIVFLNTSVHRHHAVLTQDPNGQFVITDLGGTNGTIVNGSKRDKSVLQDNDVIELGEVRMRFRIPSGK